MSRVAEVSEKFSLASPFHRLEKNSLWKPVPSPTTSFGIKLHANEQASVSTHIKLACPNEPRATEDQWRAPYEPDQGQERGIGDGGRAAGAIAKDDPQRTQHLLSRVDVAPGLRVVCATR